MKQRVNGRKPKPLATPLFADAGPCSRSTPQVVLGVDPSLRGTGFGIVRFGKGRPEAVAFGVISSPPGWERSRCLLKIAQGLRQVLNEHHPTICVVESLFYAQNLQTALI